MDDDSDDNGDIDDNGDDDDDDDNLGDDSDDEHDELRTDRLTDGLNVCMDDVTVCVIIS